MRLAYEVSPELVLIDPFLLLLEQITIFDLRRRTEHRTDGNLIL